MKFKLFKSNHHSYFNMLKLIEKSTMTLRENKTSKDDSLIFFNKDNRLHIYVGNSTQYAYFDLKTEVNDIQSFAVDFQTFNLAFNNFPTDEINFFYDSEKQSLIFGNKKTKVALNTSVCDNIEYINSFLDSNCLDKQVNNLYEALKCSSFSCSIFQEEYPYTEIMLSLKSDSFSAFSSDKHRISLYGIYESDNSFLISKNHADIICQYLKEFTNSTYCIEGNILYIKNETYKLGTSLQKNNSEEIFNKFISFINESQIVCNFILNKIAIIKSLKFISSVSGNDTIDFTFEDNQILLSGSTQSKGIVADKITLSQTLPSLNVSYVQNHIIKALDAIDSENINCQILDFNEHLILKVSHNKFDHLIFPMG